MDDLVEALARVSLLAPTTEESAWVVVLQAGAVIAVELLASGGPSHVRAAPAAVLRPVLHHRGDALVLVHTHLDHAPPSTADHAVTRRLRAAAAVVGLHLRAHVVLTPGGSFACGGERREAA